jgi:hypothetical protein
LVPYFKEYSPSFIVNFQFISLGTSGNIYCSNYCSFELVIRDRAITRLCQLLQIICFTNNPLMGRPKEEKEYKKDPTKGGRKNNGGSLELGLSILTPNPYTLTYMPYT